MTSMAAKKAKDQFGLLLDTAQREPVIIEKKKRQVAVLLSLEEYKRLEAIEDLWWALKADQALKEGFHGVQGSTKIMAHLRQKNA